jgi:hypothetical protein
MPDVGGIAGHDHLPFDKASGFMQPGVFEIRKNVEQDLPV